MASCFCYPEEVLFTGQIMRRVTILSIGALLCSLNMTSVSYADQKEECTAQAMFVGPDGNEWLDVNQYELCMDPNAALPADTFDSAWDPNIGTYDPNAGQAHNSEIIPGQSVAGTILKKGGNPYGGVR